MIKENDKIKSRQKFLFIDNNKKNEISKKTYLTHNNKSKSLFNINNFNDTNNKENFVLNQNNYIHLNNKQIANQQSKNQNPFTTKRIKPKLFLNKYIENVDNEENNRGWETSRIPPPKSMNLNNIQEKSNSINKNININNEIKNREKMINLNINKVKIDNHIFKKIQKKTIISRNISRNNRINLEKKEQFKTVQNEKNSSITYNKKFILSRNISNLNNNYDNKTISKENFNTINISQKIKNNKLNSFQTSSIIFSKKKKIIPYQNSNEQNNIVNDSKKLIFKNGTATQKIPRLSLKDIKDTSSFLISPINSSRYNSKNKININFL